jgi:dTDP-4-amino-4,6-dideoxygalactose transaminase
LSADYGSIEPILAENGMWMLCDTAQGFGARYGNRRTGAIGTFASTSFFPAKPLGCYGDGGAVFVHTKADFDILKSLRVHGQGVDKYDNVRIGMNGRMDTIQAAVLLHKLSIFEDEIAARNRIAGRYSHALADVAMVPFVPEDCVSTWAQYTLRVRAEQREPLIETLARAGIPTAVYYRYPMHRQTAYKHFPIVGEALPVSDTLAKECVSLPMHPYLDEATQDEICGLVRRALSG